MDSQTLFETLPPSLQALHLRGVHLLSQAVTHRLNNCLSGVVGYADLLPQTTPEQQPAAMDRLRQAADACRVSVRGFDRYLLLRETAPVGNAVAAELSAVVEYFDILMRRCAFELELDPSFVDSDLPLERLRLLTLREALHILAFALCHYQSACTISFSAARNENGGVDVTVTFDCASGCESADRDAASANDALPRLMPEDLRSMLEHALVEADMALCFPEELSPPKVVIALSPPLPT